MTVFAPYSSQTFLKRQYLHPFDLVSFIGDEYKCFSKYLGFKKGVNRIFSNQFINLND